MTVSYPWVSSSTTESTSSSYLLESEDLFGPVKTLTIFFLRALDLTYHTHDTGGLKIAMKSCFWSSDSNSSMASASFPLAVPAFELEVALSLSLLVG